MKNRINLICICSLAISLFTSGCNKDQPLPNPLNEEIEIEDEALEEVITPIDLDVTVKNGALVFENGEDFLHARNVLWTVNLASRLAWEKSIGFKSIRRVYEEILKDFNDGKSLDTDSYSSIIDFSGSTPLLKNHELSLSSILNLDQIFYVGEAIGTIRTDGSFWVMDGDVNKLHKLIQNPEQKTDEEKGLIVMRNRFIDHNNDITFRSCTVGIEDEYYDYQVLNNGTDRGATELRAKIKFQVLYYPSNPQKTLFNYSAELFMEGRSYRRKRCRCGWDTYQDDHIFTWNVEIGRHRPSNPTEFISYSGTDTHVHNHLAIKHIFLEIFSDVTPSWLQDNYYFLHKINSGTSHTTENLDLPGIFYSCN